jgi:hypothetical protein
MAKISDYEIVTFQRAPGCWRASITQKGAAVRTHGSTMRSFLTDEDATSDSDALMAASEAIKNLDE